MTSLTDKLKAAGGGTNSSDSSSAPAASTGDLTGKLRGANEGSTVAPPPTPPAAPDPNAYKPPDWIPGAGFLYKTNRILENALLPGADYLTAKAGDLARSIGISNTTPSVAQLRAETEQNRKDVGPVASTAADIAGYGMGPGRVLGPLAGRFAPVAGRYGAAALEGATANTLNSVGGQLGGDIDPWKVAGATVTGGAGGAAGQAAGDVASAVARPIADYVSGKPGRGGELWNWRTRAAQGQDITPDIRRYQQYAPPGGPEQTALANLQTALGQSTAPGPVATAAKGAATAAGGWAGFSHLNNLLEALGGAGVGTYLGDRAVDPIARRINTIDRNINVGQAFDQAYPVLTAQPSSTTDTSGWADAIRQGFIGSTGSLGPSGGWR